MNYLLESEVKTIKRKFNELTIENKHINKQQKLNNGNKINLVANEVDKNFVCDLHHSFNSCMMYNCPGIKSNRLTNKINNSINSINVERDQRNKFEFYS
jgi:hypothetical protein